MMIISYFLWLNTTLGHSSIRQAGIMAKIAEEASHSSKFTTCCSMIASIISVSAGYQFGVMSGAAIFMKEDLNLNDEQVELLMGMISFVSIAGTALAGRTCDKIGRRLSIMLSAVIFMVGSAIMAVAPNYAVAIIGRIIVGIGFGCSILVPNIYTAEISSSSSRGILSCIPEMSFSLGLLIGYVINYALSGLPPHLSWRLMMALGITPPLIVVVLVPFMPETPQWLAMNGRGEEALVVLLKTLGGSKDLAIARLEEITEGIQCARQNAGGGPEMGTWREILKPTPVLRRMLVIGIGVQLLQQLSGIGIVMVYSPLVFRRGGMTSKKGMLAATIGVGFAKAAFVGVAAMLVENTGRRKLLMMSTSGTALFYVILGLSLMFGGASVVAVLAACGAVSFYSIGLGPMCGLIGSEIYPSRIRSKASSVGVMLNRLASGLVYVTFLSISNAVGVPTVLFGYAGIGMVGFFFVYHMLPETKGRSLEEIVASFHTHADKRSNQVLENK